MSHSAYSTARRLTRPDTSHLAVPFDLQGPGYERCKRAMDLAGSFLSLILLLPLLVALSFTVAFNARNDVPKLTRSVKRFGFRMHFTA